MPCRQQLRAIAWSIVMLAIVPTITSANAADLPYRKADPVPYNSADWSGLYAGVSVGAIWANDTWTSDETVAVSTRPGLMHISGWSVGGIFGANIQHGRTVLGAELDINRLCGCATTVGPGWVPGTLESGSTSLKWSGHARARFGYAFDNWLPFVAAGVAIMNTQEDFATTLAGVPASLQSINRIGMTVGAGVDWMAMPNLVMRVEYLYDNYGSITISGSPTFFDMETFKSDSHTVRVAAIWKFN